MIKVSNSGGVPSLPLWLTHTQIRLIPIGKQHMSLCQEIATELSDLQIRTDIDDRDESIGKRIRESETEWIRYTLVIGDKEMETKKFVVRDRNERRQREVTLLELVNEVST